MKDTERHQLIAILRDLNERVLDLETRRGLDILHAAECEKAINKLQDLYLEVG